MTNKSSKESKGHSSKKSSGSSSSSKSKGGSGNRKASTSSSNSTGQSQTNQNQNNFSVINNTITSTSLMTHSGRDSPITSLVNHGSTTTGSGSSQKEKTHHKYYAAFSPKSIKCMWEQYDTSDTEINSDVFSKLADEVSYKVWELVGSLKTYARHSGGKVTTDLVNEVLKDCDVGPIIGASSSTWDRIEYEGTYYFQNDDCVNLTTEYLKDINKFQSGQLSISTSWSAPQESENDINKLCDAIIQAITVGDESAFRYAIHTVFINPFIGSMLDSLIGQIIEMLMFEYTVETLDRCLKLLKVLAYNITISTTKINRRIGDLSQLFVCLLLGPFDLNQRYTQNNEQDLKIFDELVLQHKQNDAKTNIIINELDSTIKCEPGVDVSFGGIDVDDFGNKYEDLLQMMKSEGFDKPENEDQLELNNFKIEEPSAKPIVSTLYGGENVSDFIDVKPNVLESFADGSSNEMSEPKSENPEEINEIYSPITTVQCPDKLVNDLCSAMALLAARWGFLENELIHIIGRRLETFFQTVHWTFDDYNFLTRTVLALSSLGNLAFRELFPYFDKINTAAVPEYVQLYFNPCAIFIEGYDDIYFYEWMNDLCGDGLLPFMIYYPKILDICLKLCAKNNLCLVYRIKPKLVLKTLPHRTSAISFQSINDVFPDRNLRLCKSKKISFKFHGCSPVIRKVKTETNVVRLSQNNDMMADFNSKYVVCKRRLLKSLFGYKKVNTLGDFRYFQL